jgi:hypothetical protein
MTELSTRRAAEMTVISAAHMYVAEPLGPGNYRKLIGAVEKHQKIGLDATVQAAVSNNTTDTSTAAAASVADSVGKSAGEIFDEIAVVAYNTGVGLTVDQIEQILNRTHQSVSARVNGLRDKGWVVDSGIKRTTRSGRKAIVWAPTTLALQKRRINR